MEVEYISLAERIAEGLRTDSNVLAIMVYGSVATRTATEKSDIDLLLLVEEMPDDVDMFGVRRTSIDGVTVDLAYKTVEQVSHQIDYEAGSWYSSSVMLNSIVLYDSKGMAEALRNRVLEMPDERREFIYDCLIEDAKTYPDKIRQCIEMGDFRGATYLTRLAFDNLVQVMFMINRTRPASEKGMVRDFLALEDLPEGFQETYDLIGGFEIIGRERADAALEAFEHSIRKTQDSWTGHK